MEAVGAAASIGGLTTLALQSIKQSVEGLQILSNARQFSNLADLQRSRIAFERQRLLRWYDIVNSSRSNVHSSLTELDWILVQDLAVQLERLLSDADKLEQRYHLDLDDESLDKLGRVAPAPPPIRNVLDRLISKIRPANAYSQTARMIDDTATPVLRLRYGISGKTKIEELVKDIEALVTKLWQCLGESEQRIMSEGMRYLLREVLTRTSAKDEISGLQDLLDANYGRQREDRSLRALPELKQKRLDLQFDTTRNETKVLEPPVKVNRAVSANLRIKGPEVNIVKPLSSERNVATYKSETVLVEWKEITPGLEEKLEWRVKALGVLLTQTTPDILGTLLCRGSFKDIGKHRYGFVFTFPDLFATEVPVQSLFDMLAGSPPLFDQRLRIARSLARSVRQLHTVGWLHKRLRSENILFCPSAKQDDEVGPYLAGFGYARAADPTQFSESPPATPESDIYCHPDLLGGQTKVFRKKYDLFALGMVLLEIGMWKRLSSMLLAGAGFDEADLSSLYKTLTQRASLLDLESEGGPLHDLKLKYPSNFCSAISLCIHSQLEGDDEGDEDSLELQQRVCELLET